MGIACCSQGNVELVTEVASGQALPWRKGSDCGEEYDSVLEQLIGVEGDKVAQDALFKSLKSTGCIMIVTLDLSGGRPAAVDVDSHFQQLTITDHFNALLNSTVWSGKAGLVRADHCKFYAFGLDVADVFLAACQIARLSQEFRSWVAEVVLVRSIKVKIGIEAGDMVLLPGSCYGHPVNVATKLGDDLANLGEILVGEHCVTALRHSAGAKLLNNWNWTVHRTEVGGVKLSYFRGEAAGVAGLAPATRMPRLKELGVFIGLTPESRPSAVFVSDTSALAALVKAYGFLHHLRLLLTVRKLVGRHVAKQKGRLVRYEGDCVIAVFPSCESALLFSVALWRDIAQFNNGRSEHFQIRIGACLEYGTVAVTGNEVLGNAFERCHQLAMDEADITEVLLTAEFLERLPKDVIPSDAHLSDDQVKRRDEDDPHLHIHYNVLTLRVA
eukprot:TRINITY_DN60997_c0_g1_i1.p1 TRINITY_DN60997_c0_g1~~TRINITY_DN60997_c0_g1_i1.p1  ORF type:complete len:442 (+),score=68.06 TRINITY_DN60997_c0_g1_i1:98-1423(+)